MELREQTSNIDVPKNTGIEGFVLTIREILKRPRLQEIRIDARGKITYKRLVQDGEDQPLNVDLETVTPKGVMTRALLQELVLPPNLPAAVSISKMFDRFTIDQVQPLVFVSGTGTIFWEWYEATTRSALYARTHAFGMPFVLDRDIPDTALLLFGTTLGSASLIDTTHILKLEMDSLMLRPPETTVEVL